MKTTITILILFVSLSSIGQSQTTHPDVVPFVGTWEANYDQNKVFRLILRGEGDIIRGDYEIDVLDTNGNVQDTYISNFTFPNTPHQFPPAIYADSADEGVTLSGSIDDNTIDVDQGFSERKIKRGGFKLIMQSSNPTTAEWKVKRPSGHYFTSDPDYSIPTDIILTKVD